MSLKSVVISLILLPSCDIFAVFTSVRRIEWIYAPVNQIVSALRHPDGLEGGKRYTYICRAVFGEGIYGGKLVFDQGVEPRCYFGKGGSEFRKTKYEVLSAPEGSLSWEEYNGKLPENAVPSGLLDWGEHDATYVCRGLVPGPLHLITGYYHKRKCYVSYYREYPLTQFEVLVKNEYGILKNY